MRLDRGCARVRKRKGERKDDGGKGGWRDRGWNIAAVT